MNVKEAILSAVRMHLLVRGCDSGAPLPNIAPDVAQVLPPNPTRTHVKHAVAWYFENLGRPTYIGGSELEALWATWT